MAWLAYDVLPLLEACPDAFECNVQVCREAPQAAQHAVASQLWLVGGLVETHAQGEFHHPLELSKNVVHAFMNQPPQAVWRQKVAGAV